MAQNCVQLRASHHTFRKYLLLPLSGRFFTLAAVTTPNITQQNTIQHHGKVGRKTELFFGIMRRLRMLK
jgi:hypothetical protein